MKETIKKGRRIFLAYPNGGLTLCDIIKETKGFLYVYYLQMTEIKISKRTGKSINPKNGKHYIPLQIIDIMSIKPEEVPMKYRVQIETLQKIGKIK